MIRIITSIQVIYFHRLFQKLLPSIFLRFRFCNSFPFLKFLFNFRPDWFIIFDPSLLKRKKNTHSFGNFVFSNFVLFGKWKLCPKTREIARITMSQCWLLFLVQIQFRKYLCEMYNLAGASTLKLASLCLQRIYFKWWYHAKYA